jgi:hypothetical protein
MGEIYKQKDREGVRLYQREKEKGERSRQYETFEFGCLNITTSHHTNHID